MAKRTRALGLSKSRKQQKLNNNDEKKEKSTTPQLNIEIDDEENADNVTVQLVGLWNSYLESTRDSDALLNGIVNECDTLLSNKDKSNATELEKLCKDEQFLAVFALGLSELTIFHEDKIKEYFDDSLDVIDLFNGNECNLLEIVKSKINFQRIPLEFISKLEIDSNKKSLSNDINLNKLLEDGKKSFENIAKLVNVKGSKRFINGLVWETLSIFNDLLDIVENFGTKKNLDEGLDSDLDEDEEDNEDGDGDMINLKKDHPLFKIQSQLDVHYQWLRGNLIKFITQIEPSTKMYYNVAKLIGEIFLKESELPSQLYLSLQYGDDDEEEEIAGEDKDEEMIKVTQKEAQDLVINALKYLEMAQDPENADTWAQLAEGYIDLGNIQDNESSEQEKSYQTAETILKKANVASHNKYQYILDNLNSDTLSNDVERTNI